MNELQLIFDKYQTDKGSFGVVGGNGHFYHQVYNDALKPYQDKPIDLLEIGIWEGGSIRAFKEYFQNGNIYAFDIENKSHFTEDRIFIEKGDESDREFLKNVFTPQKKFDIILDDGGHYIDHQQIALDELFSRLNSGGLYILEDLHTSLWSSYGGAPDKKDTPLSLLLDIQEQKEIDISLYPHIKNLEVILNSIQSCTVHIGNGGNSITSLIYKK